MGDNDYELQERMAQDDQTDAARLQADAASLRTEAQHDFTQADSLDHMGLPAQGAVMRVEGSMLQGQAEDFDYRAAELTDAAADDRSEKALLQERDRVNAGAGAAEAHAAGAQVVLDFAELSEADRTRWTAEAGAATGEAGALHKRSDELTNEAVQDGHDATEVHDAAHAGLDGRQWTGEGHPPGQGGIANQAE